MSGGAVVYVLYSRYGGGAIARSYSSVVSCFRVLLCLALWYSMMIVAIAHTTSRHTTSTTTGTITVVIVEAFAAIVTVGIVTIVEDMVVALVLVTWGLAAMVTVGIVTIVEDVIVALVLVT